MGSGSGWDVRNLLLLSVLQSSSLLECNQKLKRLADEPKFSVKARFCGEKGINMLTCRRREFPDQAPVVLPNSCNRQDQSVSFTLRRNDRWGYKVCGRL